MAAARGGERHALRLRLRPRALVEVTSTALLPFLAYASDDSMATVAVPVHGIDPGSCLFQPGCEGANNALLWPLLVSDRGKRRWRGHDARDGEDKTQEQTQHMPTLVLV